MERAATLRVITASGAAQQFFLRVSRDGDGTLTLTLCDGCTTWGGTVRDSGLTPPKLGMTHTDFAERLLDGLQGAAGTEASTWYVSPPSRRPPAPAAPAPTARNLHSYAPSVPHSKAARPGGAASHGCPS